MKKIWIFALLTGFLLAGCVSVSSGTATPTSAPQFVTSTLPPTKALVLPSTVTPSTPDADENEKETGTPVPTSPPNCKVQAVLLEDVTIPDDTVLEAGETFTKTWRFKNTGSCHWKGYTINFLTGDRMGAPDSVPIPDTIAGESVDVSVELTAPTADGSYSAYYVLKNADGESILIGTEKTFWLKIIVGDGGNESSSSTTTDSSSNSASGSVASCDYSENASYVVQMQVLINSEREKNGLPELTVNSQLASAAKNHSVDLACNNLTGHTGSDGSYVNTRIVAAGYSPSFSEEIVYVGGDPQTAFNWWMNDKAHRNAILGTKATQMGVGYAYSTSSAYGSYFTVDFASP